jgi:DNA-binding NtrC family response regulator
VVHRLLLLEEDPAGLSSVAAALGREKGFVCERRAWDSPLEDLASRGAEIVVASCLPQPDQGLRFLRRLRQGPLAVPTVAVLPQEVEESVLHETSRAVEDFVLWPLARPSELEERLRRLLQPAGEGEGAYRRLTRELGLNQLVGRDPRFVRVLEKIPLLARTDGPALISGETGTGKELCARAIHHLSRRSHHPFIPVDCGAVPDHLFENELFGHARGAFTDARDDQRGLIAMAEQGTLFLDEIDSLSLPAQAKLLRFLQERTYKPLGAERFVKANVSVIAATNRELEPRVRDGQLRADLFFRLNVLRIEVPPLRERRGDIPLLARHFVEVLGAQAPGPRPILSAAAAGLLERYDWPGNVRELHGVIQAAVVFARSARILPGDLGLPRAAPATPRAGGFRQARARAIEAFERLYVEDLLRKHRGNITRAALEAGKERRSLGRLVKKYRIDRLTL